MKKMDFLEENIAALFFKYLIPSISASLVTSIYILVDTIIVGKGIGADAVAALNIILPLFSVFFGTGLLFGVGGAVLMSFYNGSGNTKKANIYFTISLLAAVFMIVVYVVLGITCFDKIAYALGATEVTIDYVRDYGKFVVLGIPVFVLSTFLQTFVRNDKSPKLAMLSSISGGVINIIFDCLFVFGFNWGIGGAAFASVIGTTIGVLIVCTHFFSKENHLHINFKGVTLKDLYLIVKNGVSSFIIEIATGIVIFIFNIQLLQYVGEIGVTVYGIISNTTMVVASLSNGISQASQPIIAVNYGAGKLERVNKIKKIGMLTALAVGMMFLAAGVFMPNIIINIFINPTPSIMELAPQAVKICSAAFLAMTMNIFIINFYQSVLKPNYALIICMLRGLILNIIFVQCLPLFYDVNGIWLTMPATEFLTLSVAFAILYLERRKSFK